MSTIVTSNVSDGTLSIPTTYVTNGSAKVWVNFDGTGTIAERDSFNVSSLTDNSTGDYTFNFTTAMANTTYVLSGAIGDSGLFASFRSYGSYPPTASAVRVASTAHDGALYDMSAVTIVVHGDLA